MNQMEDLLNSLGFGYPESSEELDHFRKFYSDYKFKANGEAIDPTKIIESINKQDYIPSYKDYHKRTVLAAEIVYQLHEEWSLGHLKLQKLIFLCQNSLNMAIHTNFLKQAMGPYDPKLMRSIDSQFIKNKWFKYDQSAKKKYQLLEKAGEHKEWYERYYQNEIEGVNTIIGIFRKMKTRQVELVGTLYACWLESIKENGEFIQENVVSKFYSWSVEKEKFSESEVEDGITWMLDYKIYPETDNNLM